MFSLSDVSRRRRGGGGGRCTGRPRSRLTQLPMVRRRAPRRTRPFDCVMRNDTLSRGKGGPYATTCAPTCSGLLARLPRGVSTLATSSIATAGVATPLNGSRSLHRFINKYGDFYLYYAAMAWPILFDKILTNLLQFIPPDLFHPIFKSARLFYKKMTVNLGIIYNYA